ncbi:hypothetical protein EKO04_002008 [Ascochyta lentis]|uniref:Uncharacterized protein n=1 Tax=Ascochyta lentis TaxID=205686 RepID=A0A8H7JD29_9PLEO|nr:hypothetical protein EKO04_002008 [Ascochyta lentis]
MTSPTASLLEPPQPKTRLSIASSLWGAQSFIPTSEAYWFFYIAECQRALQDNGQHVLARTHKDVLDTVAHLKADQLREQIRKVLHVKFTKPHHSEIQLVDRSIDLAATLLLMTDVGSIQYGFSGRQRLHWREGTLRECVASGFTPSTSLDHKGIKLQRLFNASSLVRIAGLELVPTTNLLDHLRLTDDDTKLQIFHHASFLKHQTDSSLFPSGLAEETLRTLALLFPQSDGTLRKWYRRLPMPFPLDPELVRCGHLKTEDRQFEKFAYWHDRLVVLKQVFDEATPENMSQWWFDRRNSVQWWTFWIAILVLVLTILFGFTQCITGIMQVYAAFKIKA